MRKCLTLDFFPIIYWSKDVVYNNVVLKRIFRIIIYFLKLDIPSGL